MIIIRNTGKDLGVKEMGLDMNLTWADDINVLGESEIWICAIHTTVIVMEGNISYLFLLVCIILFLL